MVTRELRSLVKLSEKRGRFDYYDGLVYYMIVVYNVPILAIPDRMNEFVPKFNKFLHKDIGIRISREGVIPVLLNKSREDEVYDKLHELSPNCFYLESMPGIFFSPLLYGHKLTYKVAKVNSVCRIAKSRFYNSLLDSKVDIGDVGEFVKNFIIRDESIFDCMIKLIPSEINPVILNEDCIVHNNVTTESDLSTQYTFQFDEFNYIKDRYTKTGSLKDTNLKGIKMVDRTIEVSKRWLFSGCKTIKEFVNS